MSLTPTIVQKIIGARGLDPRLYPYPEYWALREIPSDGLGIRWDINPDGSPKWNTEALGALPNTAEIALANAPQIALQVATNGAGDGLIFTATLTGAGAGVTTNWRLTPPSGDPVTDTGTTLASGQDGVDSWEVITSVNGPYLMAVWNSAYGYAELSTEGV